MARWNLTVELDDAAVRERLSGLRDTVIPEVRHAAVRDEMLSALEVVVQANPVDTGRSRSAWVHGIEQLGGAAPADWAGGQATLGALGEGAAAAFVTVDESPQTSAIAVENGVPYIAFLEYGTRGQPPRSMVRRGIQSALQGLVDRLRRALPLS